MKIHPMVRKVTRVILSAAAGFLLLIVLLLMSCQRRLIYFPQPYEPTALRWLTEHDTVVRYDVGGQPQQAYYVAPREGTRPDRLWVAFNGNASLALSWMDFAGRYPDPRAAFLVIDYPGYGANKGRPTRDSIVEAGTAALAAARLQLALGDSPASPPLGLLGHSLGAAAALELAARSQPDRVVLISPFTSLLAMARRTVGWPLCYLLLDRFDNAARLDELALRVPRPDVTIFHGTADPIVPFEMGRALAAAHADWIDLHPITNGDHNFIIDSATPAIYRAMLGEDLGIRPDGRLSPP